MEKGGFDAARMDVTGNRIVVEYADASVLDGTVVRMIADINNPMETVRPSGTKDTPAETSVTKNDREDNRLRINHTTLSLS